MVLREDVELKEMRGEVKRRTSLGHVGKLNGEWRTVLASFQSSIDLKPTHGPGHQSLIQITTNVLEKRDFVNEVRYGDNAIAGRFNLITTA